MEPSPVVERMQEKRKSFVPGLIVTECLGVLAVALVVVWTAHYLDGFAMDGSGKTFNWHPVFMVIAFVFLYGNSILIYRILHKSDKFFVKLIHTLIHVASLICAVFALIAVFWFHNHNNIPNMYSLHSWIGLTTVILFFLQFGLGFAAYLFPKAPEDLRKNSMPIHRFMGVALFVMAVASVVTGITEKLIFLKDYIDLPDHAYVGNFLGVSVILFALGVGILVVNPNYQRSSQNGSDEYHALSDPSALQ